MKNLHITNAHFITYKDELLTLDILGGVDVNQVERMVCTLRVTHQHFPPHRTTLDLYNDDQTEKLMRTLCDKWELKLLDVSQTLHHLTLQLEEYRLHELKFLGKNRTPKFEVSAEEAKAARQFLKDENLLNGLIKSLNTTGVLGEDENAVILFLAMASHKFSNPFSVLCLAKSGIGKSYILQKLSECLPQGTFSMHTRISANALYYFDSTMIQNKALIIEDLEWTTQMLSPLSTLQSQGKLVNTRATKDKDGMLHSTTFEVTANLCLIACAYNDKNVEEISLPFLCVHLNHSHAQDILIMEYQKKCKAGLIKTEEIKTIQHNLQCAIATLQSVSVINPFATLINLPEEVAYPRKSLLLLLNFIEVITYFFQYQREQKIDETTGEIFVLTHPSDVELAFKYLKNNLFRRADELSTPARGFYSWLTGFLAQAKTNQFTQLDIRKAKQMHPRTLNNYLQELKLFSYIQIVGGNKHRGGFIYKLTGFGNHSDTKSKIEQALQHTMKNIWAVYHAQKSEAKNTEVEIKIDAKIEVENPVKPKEQPAEFEQKEQVITSTKKESTLNILLELEAKTQKREYIPSDIAALSGRSQDIEARYLKNLWQQGKVNREWKNRQYYYTLIAEPILQPSTLNIHP